MSDGWHEGGASIPTATDMAVARDLVSGEMPLMGPPPSGDVTLFRGLFHEGRFMVDAEVKELTGADEEDIARSVATSQETGSYYNAVLVHGVVRIGSVYFAKYNPTERREMLDALLIGDKEWLFVNVVKMTYGDQRTIVLTCGHCGKNNDLIFTVSEDVKVKNVPDDNNTMWNFTMRDGTVLTYRLFTGGDQAESQRRRNITSAEQNTILLSRAIHHVDGKPVPDPMAFARNMGAADRRALLVEIEAKQPGPYFEEVKLPCASCGEESLFKPSWADLL